MRTYLPQMIALAMALLGVWAANKAVPRIRGARKEHGKVIARWFAFALMVFSGLCLAVALVPVVRWVTHLGTLGGILAFAGNVGAIIALWFGWDGVARSISVARDLADGVPDEEARKGALWIPTFLPAGGAAVATLLQNPRGIGSGITAAIMAGITMAYVFIIVKRALASTKHKTFWKWFAFAICFIGGLVMVPLITYLNGVLPGYLPGDVMNGLRLVVAVAGVALIAVGSLDIICDGEPDKWARNAAVFGLGIVLSFGGIGVAAMSGIASTGAGILQGMGA